MTTADRSVLAAIVVFACLLRLWDLPIVSITADEGIHGLFARNVSVLDFDKFPMVGLPSVGVRNSALFIYLLAIPNFIVRHPLAGAAFIALLQVAAIVLTYRYALRWIGRTAAVTASILWTFSPWAVIYARNMWPPSAVAPFVLLMLGFGTGWFINGDRRSLRWSILLAFIIPQVHFSGFCAPIWFGLLVLCRCNRLTKSDWSTVAAFSLFGLITWSPWICWQHFDNHWQDLAQIKAVATATNNVDVEIVGKAKPTFDAYLGLLFAYFRDLLHTDGLNYWFRTQPDVLLKYFPRWLFPLQTGVDRGLELAFLFGLVFAFKTTVGRIILVWTFLPVVLLALIRPTLHPHYEFIAYPGPYLVVGYLVRVLTRSRIGLCAACVASAFVVVAFVATLNGWRGYIADERLDGDDRYQLSYRQRLNAVRAIIADAQESRIEIAGPFNGQQPAYTLPYVQEIESSKKRSRPVDRSRVYWMDELQGDGLSQKALSDLAKGWPYLKDARIEKSWRVGPTRIFKIVGTPTGPLSP